MSTNARRRDNSTMNAKVYHNVARDDAGRHLGILDGYQPEHPVTLVFTTDLPPSDEMAACEELYRLLNVGDDPAFGQPDPRAEAYRRRGNRSLSMGDLVSLDGRFYACAEHGWKPLDTEPTVVQARVPGTTPLSEAG